MGDVRTDEAVDRGTDAVGDSRENGGAPAPRPPVRRKQGMGPALIVGAIAVFLLLSFGVLAAISSNGTPPVPSATSTHAKPVAVAGTSLRAVPAAGPLAPIEEVGTPPNNILDALSIPARSTQVSVSRTTTATTGFDRAMTFSVVGTQATVIAFFHTELSGRGWKRISQGPARGVTDGIEVLAEKAGDDGWYWEAGAIVAPTTFSGSKGTREATRYTIQLYEVPDAD